MSLDSLLLLVFVTLALIATAAILFVRDLLSRRAEKEAPSERASDDEIALPSPAEVVTRGQDVEEDWWLSEFVAQTGSEWTADTVILLTFLVGLAVGGALFVWQDDELAGITGALLGILAVGATFFFLRARRRRLLRDQLPDIMELMARAVRAGESLDQALALAGNSALQPLADEFRYCASQLKMGLSLESAMRGLVARAPIAETRILAMTLVVQRRRGGNLPLTLDRLAKVFRDRGNFARQFRAATAMGRGSVVLLGLLALGLDAVVIFGRVQLFESLLTTNAGRIMLAISIALQTLGVAWALWLFRSDY